MASPSEFARRFSVPSACLCLALGTAACRESKQAENTSADGGASSRPVLAPDWAVWPMPNTAPDLPNARHLEVTSEVVVLDRVTGLMWQRTIEAQQLSFADAKEHCAQLVLAGYDDWRLPSRLELVSILDTSRTQPAIDVSSFPDTPSDWFWSSTAAADGKAAWYVYFYFGYPNTDLVSNLFSVRCVRTAESRASISQHYDVRADTVRDLGTGLTWQRAVADQRLSFDAARSYCEGLDLAGAQGWRVPSLPELLTLIDDRVEDAPMIDRAAFPDTPGEAFWSSSYFGGTVGLSWQVYFERGNGLYGLPTTEFRVRCVTALP